MGKSKSRHKLIDGLICEYCGKEFSAREQRVKVGLGRFCSHICFSKSKILGKDKKYVGKENACVWFDKVTNRYVVYWFDPITLKRKTSTYARWWWDINEGEIPEGYKVSYKDNNNKNISPDNIVLISLEDFNNRISKRLKGRKFSAEAINKMSKSKKGKPLSYEHKLKIGDNSRKLWSEGRFDGVHVGKYNRHWRGGVEGKYPKEFNNKLKLVIKERDNYKCKICDISLYKTKKAHIHHINGDRYNNSLDNLILLCLECHSAIHNTSSREEVISVFRSKLIS